MADFHYFDQFKDVVVDLTPYLSSTSTANNFNYTFTNVQPVKATVKNIFDKIAIVKSFNQDILNFKFWIIEENERPENTAYEFYNNKDLWWAVLLFNNITDVFTQWPVNEDVLSSQADKLFKEEGLYTRATYYDLLHEQNEKKRLIKLVRVDLINDVIAKFRQEFEKSI